MDVESLFIMMIVRSDHNFIYAPIYQVQKSKPLRQLNTTDDRGTISLRFREVLKKIHHKTKSIVKLNNVFSMQIHSVAILPRTLFP